MDKLKALFTLFKQGAAVSDPKLWKERQITVTLLAGAIVAAIQVLIMFGINLPVDTETANMIAAGVIGIVNVVLTITTSPTVGLPVKQEYPTLIPELVSEKEYVSETKSPEVKAEVKAEITRVRPEDNLYIN